MLYLITGANGSCKTLFTLADVRALQLKENRPVCINQRFKMKPEKQQEFGWRTIDFKDWQDQPDGTIFLIDECHNDLPVRANSAAVPEPVRMLAEHRARGFDFYLLTQHPMNIDAFVRKLIGAPGYHRHHKRVFGGTNMTRVLQWDAVRSDCEKDGSGKSAQISTRSQPKEVYDWYESATLHTAKVRIPVQVYTLLVCIVLFIALLWYAFERLKPKEVPVNAEAPTAQKTAPAPVQGQGREPEKHVQTAAEYAQSFQPRIEGLAYTAPRYDEQTKPTTAPYPAACLQMGSRCECFTQQGTKMPVPQQVCLQIVKGGFFMDWNANGGAQGVAVAPVSPAQKLTGGTFPDAAPVVVATADRPSPDADLIQSVHRQRHQP
jgi:zona occludens toxin